MNEIDIYRIETTVDQDGTISVTGLPLRAGDKVDVTVRLHQESPESYPLQGLPPEYVDPFGSVADQDWDALK